MKTVKVPQIIIDGVDYSDQLKGRPIKRGNTIIQLPKNYSKNQNIQVTIKKDSTSNYNNFLSNVYKGIKYENNQKVLQRVSCSSGNFDIVDDELYYKNNMIDNTGKWTILSHAYENYPIYGVKDGTPYLLDQEQGSINPHDFPTSWSTIKDLQGIRIPAELGIQSYMYIGTLSGYMTTFNNLTRTSDKSQSYKQLANACFNVIYKATYRENISPYYCYSALFKGISSEWVRSLSYNSLDNYTLKAVCPTGYNGGGRSLYIVNGYLCRYTGTRINVSSTTTRPTSYIVSSKGWTHLSCGVNYGYGIRNGILYVLYTDTSGTIAATVLNDKNNWIDIWADKEKGYGLTEQGHVYELTDKTVKVFEADMQEELDYTFNSGIDNKNVYPQITLTKEFLNSLIM